MHAVTTEVLKCWRADLMANVGDNTNMFTILGDEEEDDGCGDSYRSDHEDSEEPENGAINVLHAVASAEST
jgi:hypothetical protein